MHQLDILAFNELFALIYEIVLQPGASELPLRSSTCGPVGPVNGAYISAYLGPPIFRPGLNSDINSAAWLQVGVDTS